MRCVRGEAYYHQTLFLCFHVVSLITRRSIFPTLSIPMSLGKKVSTLREVCEGLLALCCLHLQMVCPHDLHVIHYDVILHLTSLLTCVHCCISLHILAYLCIPLHTFTSQDHQCMYDIALLNFLHEIIT